MIKQISIVFAVLFTFYACSQNSTHEPSAGSTFPQLSKTDSLEIANILMDSQRDWNAGDLESFMKTYWRSDSVAFVGASGPIYGYESTLERYQKSYPDTTTMGQLEFDILRLYQIDQHTALLIGKFYLTRSIADLQGHYTLIWRKLDGEWKIISDHSSGKEVEE
jgi:ketosteroid isomerase-like protein